MAQWSSRSRIHDLHSVRVPSLLSSFSHPSIPIDGSSEGLTIGEHEYLVHLQSSQERNQRQVTIDILPDGVLLEIFHSYVNDLNSRTSEWHLLLHVCQRWRYLMFESPRHLGLRLEYTGKKPIKEMLDVWPSFPIVISQSNWDGDRGTSCAGNITTALESEHHDRIYGIQLLEAPTRILGRIVGAMQKPFPELSNLLAWVIDNGAPVLPDLFLGGSAPRLQILSLEGISFPSIPKFLMSASNLVILRLWEILDSGYLPPKAFVTCLPAIPRLSSLVLTFQSPRSRPDPSSRLPPSLTSSVLPALTSFEFKGTSEYLEDIMASINAPLLYNLRIVFYMDLMFEVPHFHRFISQIEQLKNLNQATVDVSGHDVNMTLSHQTNSLSYNYLWLQIRCRESDWLLSSLAQVCQSPFSPFSTLERLDIMDDLRSHSPPRWKDDMESTQWLELLYPFTALKTLRLSKEVAIRVGQALEELAMEKVAEVLPTLQTLFFKELQSSGPVHETIEKFVTARRLSGRPIAVDRWGELQL